MILHERLRLLANAILEYEAAVNEPGPHSMTYLAGLAALQTRLCSLSLAAAPLLRSILQNDATNGDALLDTIVDGSLNIEGDG